MSAVPSPRMEVHRASEGHHLREEGAVSFEQGLIRRHIEDVLDGKSKIDTSIVGLAGGFARFEEQMDYCENHRHWQALQSRASIWRRILRRISGRVNS